MIREYIVKKKPFIQKAIQFTPELTDEELRNWSDNKAFITQLDRDQTLCNDSYTRRCNESLLW